MSGNPVLTLLQLLLEKEALTVYLFIICTTVVIAHLFNFCASQDTCVSYGWCFLRQIFLVLNCAEKVELSKC